jgi:hypothetical protein
MLVNTRVQFIFIKRSIFTFLFCLPLPNSESPINSLQILAQIAIHVFIRLNKPNLDFNNKSVDILPVETVDCSFQNKHIVVICST